MNILKKKAVAFICVLTLTISCSIVLPGCSEKNKYTFDGVPEEFTVCLENALDALKESGAASVPFSYFPNEELKSAREGANGNLISYTIDSAQKINDNLYAYEVTMDVKAKLFCPEIAGLFCRIAGLFCHDSRANLSLKPVCFGIAIS